MYSAPRREQNFKLLHVLYKIWFISQIFTKDTLIYLSVDVYSGLQVLHLIMVNMASLAQVIKKIALDPYT